MCYSVMLQRAVEAYERRFPHLERVDMPDYDARHARDPKLFPVLEDRLFQNRFAPVLIRAPVGSRDDSCRLELMRYSAFPPDYIANSKGLTTFNARRDNLLSPFWKGAFGTGHGVILVKGFFEWVAVKDLLSAGVVSLPEVVAVFAAQRAARMARIANSGKPYKLTKAEETDPRFRKIVIQFSASGHECLIVPVIFNRQVLNGESVGGFAIVTDEPPPEVRAAGHDRCPVFLNESAAQSWLDPVGKTARMLDSILSQRPQLSFAHVLDKAA